jgi:hypothetical protein
MIENFVSEIMTHENGLQYKEIEFQEGIKLKLFNTNKPQRLEEESMVEYRIRRKLNNSHLRNFLKGEVVYDSSNRKPFVKPNKEKK